MPVCLSERTFLNRVGGTQYLTKVSGLTSNRTHVLVFAQAVPYADMAPLLPLYRTLNQNSNQLFTTQTLTLSQQVAAANKMAGLFALLLTVYYLCIVTLPLSTCIYDLNYLD